MSDIEDEEFKRFVKNSIKPIELELRRDLWPEMNSRLRPVAIQVPWFDWVLAAIVVITCLLVPETLGGLLFHL